jgi:hypothetical protein
MSPEKPRELCRFLAVKTSLKNSGKLTARREAAASKPRSPFCAKKGQAGCLSYFFFA